MRLYKCLHCMQSLPDTAMCKRKDGWPCSICKNCRKSKKKTKRFYDEVKPIKFVCTRMDFSPDNMEPGDNIGLYSQIRGILDKDLCTTNNSELL